MNAPLQALIIDSWFDSYLGVVSLVRIKSGVLRKGMRVKVFSARKTTKLMIVAFLTLSGQVRLSFPVVK